MFHALKTPSNALSILRGVPRPPRRDILPTQLTSTAIRSHTTYAYVLNNLERTRRSKWTRRIIYGLLFGGVGYYAGKALILDWCFPPLPGSRMDVEQMKLIRLLLDDSSTTRQLRLDPKFVEWEAYEGVSTGDKEKRLTSGPLKGSRGLAVQKIFWNEEDKICVNILHFGKTLEGWPTIVHGGLLATVLDETLGRVAIRSVPAQTGVTAHLDVTYKASVYAGEPYMITACLDKERSTDRKAYVTGEIRDTSGKVCCEAEALFVVPKGMPLRKIVELF